MLRFASSLAHSRLIILGPADIGLLKELKAAGERGLDLLAKNGT
jgi:hypothetical protein